MRPLRLAAAAATVVALTTISAVAHGEVSPRFETETNAVLCTTRSLAAEAERALLQRDEPGLQRLLNSHDCTSVPAGRRVEYVSEREMKLLMPLPQVRVFGRGRTADQSTTGYMPSWQFKNVSKP